MPGGRRGLVAPQNTFLENIIRRSNSQREFLFQFVSNCSSSFLILLAQGQKFIILQLQFCGRRKFAEMKMALGLGFCLFIVLQC